jgi:hypothetical protein
MKKTLIILAVLISPLFKGQNPNIPIVNVWRVLPQNACPGDTLRVNFKFNPPTQGTMQTTYFNIYNGSTVTTVWNGNWNTFYSLPKETWAPLATADSCYLMKLVVPFGLSGCSCASVTATGDDMGFTLNVCATSIQEETLNDFVPTVYFDLYGNKTDKKPNTVLIEQRGTTRKKVIVQP